MSAPRSKPEVLQTLIDMITDVLGEDLGVEAGTSFRDELGFQSIQFVALAELVQERYDDVDFVSWLSEKEISEILALRVGDVTDFIVASAAA